MNNSNGVVENNSLKQIRRLLNTKYGYDKTDFFINLTGPVRDTVLNDSGNTGKIIEDNKTTLNILSQEEEKDLESADFENCLEDIKKTLPDIEEIWSVGGSSSQRMFSKTGNEESMVPIGAVKIKNSTDEEVEKHVKKILSSNNVLLYNAIGYQYDNVNVVENINSDLLSRDIKLITGGTFVSTGEDDCCKLLKKILNLLKEEGYNQKKVYLVKRNGKTVIDALVIS